MIKTAIKEKKIIHFVYDGYNRVLEPHVYGVLNSKYELLGYQIDSSSTEGDLPNWRFEIDKIINPVITERSFLKSVSFRKAQ